MVGILGGTECVCEGGGGEEELCVLRHDFLLILNTSLSSFISSLSSCGEGGCCVFLGESATPYDG